MQLQENCEIMHADNLVVCFTNAGTAEISYSDNLVFDYQESGFMYEATGNILSFKEPVSGEQANQYIVTGRKQYTVSSEGIALISSKSVHISDSFTTQNDYPDSVLIRQI